MRRALLDRLPALTYHFGLRPWELEHLTGREVAVYLQALDQLNQRGEA